MCGVGVGSTSGGVIGGGTIEKHRAQICGYPLPRSASVAPDAATTGVPAGCEGLCVVPWQRCDKHLNWENHKRQELDKEQYVLDRNVETLKEQEEIIRAWAHRQHM